MDGYFIDLPENLLNQINRDLAGSTVEEFIVKVLEQHFLKEEEILRGGEQMVAGKQPTRTLAFQVNEEFFHKVKDYLRKHHIRQREFVIGQVGVAQALLGGLGTAHMSGRSMWQSGETSLPYILVRQKQPGDYVARLSDIEWYSELNNQDGELFRAWRSMSTIWPPRIERIALFVRLELRIGQIFGYLNRGSNKWNINVFLVFY